MQRVSRGSRFLIISKCGALNRLMNWSLCRQTSISAIEFVTVPNTRLLLVLSWKVEGVFDGTRIRAIVHGDDIITAFPLK